LRRKNERLRESGRRKWEVRRMLTVVGGVSGEGEWGKDEGKEEEGRGGRDRKVRGGCTGKWGLGVRSLRTRERR